MTLFEGRPWNYPGRAATAPGLLTRDRFLPFAGVADDVADTRIGERADFGGARLGDLLAELGRTPVSGRYPLVLVGANADPDRLREKLLEARREPVVPLLLGTLDDCAVGFAAWVSRLGYVPAALHRAPGERVGVVVGLLDRAQLVAVLETEPQATVRRVEGLLRVHGTPWRGTAYLYDSDAGVLARDGVPVPFGAPSDAFAAWPEPVRELVARETGLGLHQVTVPREVMPRLAADPALRFEIRVVLPDAGGSVRSGLGDLRAAIGLPPSNVGRF